MLAASPRATHKRSLLAATVLIGGLLLSTFNAVVAYRYFDADQLQRFNEASEDVHNNLQGRLDFFESSVRQIAATYAINPNLTPEQFSNYAFSTGLKLSDPGIISFGVFRRGKGADGKDVYTIWRREVNPRFRAKVTPTGTVVSDDPSRRSLIDATIVKGTPVLATNVPSLTPGIIPGEMIAVASYEGSIMPTAVEDRKKNVIGVAYARFDATGLFDQAIQGAGPFKSSLQLEVYDGEASPASAPLYHHQSDEVVNPLMALSARSKISLGGRDFAIRILSPHPFVRSTASLISFLFLSLGVAFSLFAFRIIRVRELKATQNQVLEGISKILTTSLDPLIVAENLTQKLLALSDWCVVELVNETGETDRHVYSASTAERKQRLGEFYRDFPPTKTKRRLTALARDTRQTQYIERVNESKYKVAVVDPARLERLMQIGFESVIIAPLIGTDRVIGSIAVYSGNPSNLYSANDVVLIEEIAVRAAHAFENARLYTESQNLNRAKDHFLAMLSHELRTPMNVILGWLEILTTEDVDKATYNQALDTLNRNARVQIQLINDLLDVSRIINGKLSLHAVPTKLDALAAGAIDSVQPAVRAKNIACRLETDGDLSCTLDPERIQQVLWNLLSNASKFTPSGGQILVRVSGEPNQVQIRVTDSGQGIEKAFLPFVFDRFRQEDAGFTRLQGGLGLGLSIVRYLVEGHGGTIAVTSPGRGLGSTFIVTLPRVAQISEDVAHLAPILPL